MQNFDKACSFLNTLSENEIIAYSHNQLDTKRTNEIDAWKQKSEEFKDALEGFLLLVENNPNQTFNNHFQKLREDFITKSSLISVLNNSKM